MKRNAVFNCLQPANNMDSTEKGRYVNYSEILVMWEKVMKMMKEGFDAMESRFKIFNDQLAHVNELIKQMEINKRDQ